MEMLLGTGPRQRHAPRTTLDHGSGLGTAGWLDCTMLAHDIQPACALVCMGCKNATTHAFRQTYSYGLAAVLMQTFSMCRTTRADRNDRAAEGWSISACIHLQGSCSGVARLEGLDTTCQERQKEAQQRGEPTASRLARQGMSGHMFLHTRNSPRLSSVAFAGFSQNLQVPTRGGSGRISGDWGCKSWFPPFDPPNTHVNCSWLVMKRLDSRSSGRSGASRLH